METKDIPGVSLKWIQIAIPELKRNHLNLDNYSVSVWDDGTAIAISFTSAEVTEAQRRGTRGSVGKFPGYAVEIDKKKSQITKSYFVR